ncbi:MAG: DEAD/DEAH box helicase [Paludibacter sp.]
MTEEQKEWFDKLVKDREDNARVIEKRSMKGVKKDVVEKYPDSAHFVYELLQNADDAKATKCEFVLEKDKLFFSHNGIVRFSVSNPETEEIDAENNSLGHINSITSVGSSTKENELSTIGKFGVGFKAVFQYTETPHVYDENYKFKIIRFVVPELLNEDLHFRKPDETVFYFPFNKAGMSAEKAYTDIVNKLKSLLYPTLFLSNLQEVSWKTDNNETGTYRKVIKETKQSGNIICEKIELLQQISLEPIVEKLWLFSRLFNEHAYSVGFFLDKHNKLIQKKLKAFCFFPTEETTELNFIIQAPFVLNNSRASIPKNQTNGWNENLVVKLAELSADSLVILKDLRLIDDNIIRIIPYKIPAEFFSAFYEIIEQKFKTEELLPSLNGEYAMKENAYWAVEPDSAKLFSNEQLSLLVRNPNAKWVFPSISRSESTEIRDYIDGGDERTWSYREPNLIKSNLDFENKITNLINSIFIQKQSFEWLHKFYAYFDGRSSYLKKYKTKSIFLDRNKTAVSAFEQRGQEFYPILFLPSNYTDSPYKHIHPELLKNEKTKEFIENFGIKKPSLKDEIYNSILPLYDNDGEIDTETHFKKFFKFWKDEGRPEDFISLIKDKEFVSYKTKENDTTYRGLASEIYYPTEDLQKYFETKPNTKFVDLEDYHSLIEDKDRQILKEFMLKIGVSELPQIISIEITDTDEKKRLKLEPSTYGYNDRNETTDKIIDGCSEILNEIEKDKSLILWKYLGRLQHKVNSYFGNGYTYFLNEELKGKHSFFYRTSYTHTFDSIELTHLKTLKWLLSNKNEFVAPHEITINELANEYEKNRDLDDLLGFKSEITLEQEKEIFINNLSDEEFIEFKRWKIEQESNMLIQSKRNFNPEENPIDKTYERIRRRIENEKEKDIEILKKDEIQKTPTESIETEEDEYLKPSVDFEKKRIDKENQLQAELEEITKIEELTLIAEESEKYSFAWFKALLELEYLNSSETNSNGKEISIRFAKAELEKGTERTLVLKNLVAPRYIPIAIEEIGDIRMKISYGKDESKTVTAEVVNVKEFTLRCKLKNSADIADVDLDKVTCVQIDIKNPIFILEQLLQQFKKLPFEDNSNLKIDLTPNIEFIFGPPGTGKTTYLARNVLIPKMQENDDLKILVLTPTNKAADVLTKRIIQEMDINQDESYVEWLVRFGITQDEEVQKNVVFKEKNFDIRRFSRNVTVTTIARFPYDSFKPESAEYPLQLQLLQWDYIVIDEASMIMLAQIMYPLCYKCDSHFIIAGDPFQIQPITSVENWKDENIYTLVELNNFANPTTVPYEYNVVNLETQYRSIPSIGAVFSKFTYNNILQHHRTEASQKPLYIKHLDIKSLNLIKFPVSRWEGIYRSKRLNNTPYHIYSALFTYEFTKYVSAQIIQNHKEFFRIGVICPYRAQASLVDKLISADREIQNSENVELQVGTIHGFQGDECDIIISLFNPPPTISSETHDKGKNMFLHKQNILNVSISRARDYLFVLMPDNETENLSNLKKILKIETLIKQSKYSEIHSHEIEEIILLDRKYLQENTFSTSHQNVNIYSEPEKHYEIRCEETAIDVQIKSLEKFSGVKIVGQIDLSQFDKYKKTKK